MVTTHVCLATTEYHQQAVDLSSPFNHEWCTYYLNSGFISVKDSSDIFVHSTKIVSESSLVEGQMVSFDIDSSGERPQAINVEILDA
jgi:cold shock CspA family protein